LATLGLLLTFGLSMSYISSDASIVMKDFIWGALGSADSMLELVARFTTEPAITINIPKSTLVRNTATKSTITLYLKNVGYRPLSGADFKLFITLYDYQYNTEVGYGEYRVTCSSPEPSGTASSWSACRRGIETIDGPLPYAEIKGGVEVPVSVSLTTHQDTVRSGRDYIVVAEMIYYSADMHHQFGKMSVFKMRCS